MPMVVMTREMGSQGKDVAAQLAERMNRRVVYHEIIEPVANKMRLRKSHVERFLDGQAGLWERFTTDKTSLAIFTADETFRFLRDGKTGVIRGWGAAHLFRDIPHVIRVRVCAPHEKRVMRMMERLGTDSREAVEREISISEEAHTAITRRHFNSDWRDPEQYDLVLSTDRLSVEECVDEIEGAMKMARFQETAESAKLAEDLATQSSVRAALKRDARTEATNLTVTCAAGRVTLAGVVETRAMAQAAEAVAAVVQGVHGVVNELRSIESTGSRYRRDG